MTHRINRRLFIGQSLAGASCLAAGGGWAESAATQPRLSAGDRVELGRTGIKASRLAMGTGMHGWQRQSDHTRLGQAKFTELIMRGVEHGLNFFDMADLYGSHPFMREALREIPREDYVLLSKIWFRPAGEWLQPSGGAKAEVDRFRKELGVDVLDVCLIHCVTNDQWADSLERVRDELSELKEKHVIRAAGVSCHDHGALKVAANHPWVDLIFARINHAGVKMDGSPEEISQTIKTARANGKAVVGMKIFGEGQLVKPEEKDASLKYVLGNDLVDAMTIGMLSPEQVDDSVQRIDKTLNA